MADTGEIIINLSDVIQEMDSSIGEGSAQIETTVAEGRANMAATLSLRGAQLSASIEEPDEVTQEILTSHDEAEKAKRYALEAQQAADDAEQAALVTRTAVNNVNANVGEIEAVVVRNKQRIAALETGAAGHISDAKVEDGVAYFYNDDGDVMFELTGIGGSGGGSGTGPVAGSVVTLTNTTGWASTTVAQDTPVVLSLEWSSEEDGVETGDGTLTVTVGGVVRETRNLTQGAFTVSVAPYLSQGPNRVVVLVTDSEGKSKSKTFTVTKEELLLASSFDDSVIQSSSLSFPFTAYGDFTKTVHFELDGSELDTMTTSSSGRELQYVIRQQAHGAHTLRVWFTAEINGQTVSSNTLYFDIIWAITGNYTPIVASSFDGSQPIQQYSTVVIPFQVYTPGSQVSDVTIRVDGVIASRMPSVGREPTSIDLRMDVTGAHTISISSGETTKNIAVTITAAEMNVEAETEALALHLSSSGRSNQEEHPEGWSFTPSGKAAIESVLTGFNFDSNGWVRDTDGVTALRVNGGARVNIPYQLFSGDYRTSGKTIEIEFAARDVQNYGTTILSCLQGGRGLVITPQYATLTSEQSQIRMQYKDEEHVRLTFVCEKQNRDRLLLAYIDSVPSAVVVYPANDDFSQNDPVGITIGSDECTVDIYCIRVYDNDLTRIQVMNNWIADTQSGSLMLERYSRNNVYDRFGKILIGNLPGDLPYMVLQCPELPQYKGDKKTITGYYTDPTNPKKSFSFSGCQINVQGTSSAPYARKNYDLQFKQGFVMNDGTTAENYELASGIIPFNRFVVKADVASSEGANNVELVKLYCELTPYKTREMQANPKVRQGIYGFPIVIFWTNTDTGETSFLGKYNFNLPKRAPAPYGYTGNMESWEFQNNTSDLMLFKDDYFDETMREDPETGDSKEVWRYDFEARFPSDEWVDYRTIQEFVSFVVSTDRRQATGNALDAPVTYEDVEYTADTAAYRLAKFRAEFPTYAELDSFLFYYIFTELFLLADSRAKNLFIGFSGSDVTTPGRIATRKAVCEPYDMDTALGTNNEGSLVFGYSLEDQDHTEGGADIFTGQQSTLWHNVRDAYPTEITRMYQNLRTGGVLNYAAVEKRFEDHQAKWPEAIWMEDSWFKYIMPLTSPDPGKEPTDAYLDMMQGSKLQQRKWWLSNRFSYMDSKWTSGDALANVIQFRAYQTASMTITPYSDLYVTVKYGSYTGKEKTAQGTPVTIPVTVDSLSDTETYVYSAPQIADIGDLAPFKAGWADFSKATRIRRIKIGDGDPNYVNGNFTRLSLGDRHPLMKTIDVRNCTALGTGNQKTIDLSGCTGIEEAYFDGTAISGVSLPAASGLRVLHLPGTVSNLTMRNQRSLTDLTCPSWANLTTLWLDNPAAAVDTEAIVNAMPAGGRVRIFNFHWEMDDLDDVALMFDKLDTMRGLDQNGNNVDKAQVFGTIHVAYAQGYILDEIQARYPDVTITYDERSCSVIYKTWDGASIIAVEDVERGGSGTRLLPDAREATAQYTYTPAGWSLTAGGAADQNALSNLQNDRIVFAAYTEVLRRYDITWKRGVDDGNDTLKTDSVGYGETPSYGGVPSSTRGSTYAFIEWEPELAPVTGAAEYTAVFRAPVTITYHNWDGTVLGTETIRYRTSALNPPTPTRAATVQYNYTFAGWSETAGGAAQSGILNRVTADKDVYAAYTAALQVYTITFVKGSADGGGTLQTAQIPYGQMAAYTGQTPTTTQQGEYQFIGWEPALAAVTGNQTYTAVFRDMSSPVVTYLKGNMVEYENDEDTRLVTYAFAYMPSLKNVKSAAENLGSDVFAQSNALEKVELTGNVNSIPINLFSSKTRMHTLILHSSQVVTLPNAGIFGSTMIEYGFGAIYVPSSLVSEYKAATNWSAYCIASIDEYPLSNYDTIKDDIETIMSYSAAGTLADHYADGATKTLTYGGVAMRYQLVDAENQIWITDICESSILFDNNNASSYVESSLKTYIEETMFPKIDAGIRTHIVDNEWTHQYCDINDNGTMKEGTFTAKVCPPSYRETTGTEIRETSGPVFSYMSNNSAHRVRFVETGAGVWWLRTYTSRYNVCVVATNGGTSSASVGATSGVVLCFKTH